MGFKFALEAYIAAEYPAGPDPIINRCVLSACRLSITMRENRGKIAIWALARNNQRSVLRSIAPKITQGIPLDVPQYFYRRGKGVADGLVRKLDGSPEVKGCFINIAQF